MSRTVFEKRWRGNPSASLTKTNENTYLAVVMDMTVTNNSATNIPVTTTTTADLPIVGQYLTYTDADRCYIESGMAILQSGSTQYSAALNGQGVLSTTTAGICKAASKTIATGGLGTIVGGGTRTVGTNNVNVLYVTGLL